MLRFFFQASSN